MLGFKGVWFSTLLKLCITSFISSHTTRHSHADFPICSQSSSPKHVKSDTYFLNPSQTVLSALPAVTITLYETLTRNSDLNCSNWLHKIRRSTSIKSRRKLAVQENILEERRTEGGRKGKDRGVFPLQQRKDWSSEKLFIKQREMLKDIEFWLRVAMSTSVLR